jgi:hypothetical protein
MSFKGLLLRHFYCKPRPRSLCYLTSSFRFVFSLQPHVLVLIPRFRPTRIPQHPQLELLSPRFYLRSLSLFVSTVKTLMMGAASESLATKFPSMNRHLDFRLLHTQPGHSAYLQMKRFSRCSQQLLEGPLLPLEKSSEIARLYTNTSTHDCS